MLLAAAGTREEDAGGGQVVLLRDGEEAGEQEVRDGSGQGRQDGPAPRRGTQAPQAGGAPRQRVPADHQRGQQRKQHKPCSWALSV